MRLIYLMYHWNYYLHRNYSHYKPELCFENWILVSYLLEYFSFDYQLIYIYLYLEINNIINFYYILDFYHNQFWYLYCNLYFFIFVFSLKNFIFLNSYNHYRMTFSLNFGKHNYFSSFAFYNDYYILFHLNFDWLDEIFRFSINYLAHFWHLFIDINFALKLWTL